MTPTYIYHFALAALACLSVFLLLERREVGECLRQGSKLHVTAAALYADCGATRGAEGTTLPDLR